MLLMKPFQRRHLRALALLSFSCLSGMTTAAATSIPTLEQRKRVEDAFIAGLVGDALALGSHYEYDAKKIKEKVGEYTQYHDPGDSIPLCSLDIPM